MPKTLNCSYNYFFGPQPKVVGFGPVLDPVSQWQRAAHIAYTVLRFQLELVSDSGSNIANAMAVDEKPHWHAVCRSPFMALAQQESLASVPRRRSLGELYTTHFHAGAPERQFLSSASFFVTFGLVRFITHAIRRGIGPFHNVNRGNLHLHHLVWGILLLLGNGYLWLSQLGTGQNGSSKSASRATAILYGVGSALTLDEFALWLNLKDVYWAREGRESVDAVVLWGAILSMGFWGRAFFRAVWHELTRL